VHWRVPIFFYRILQYHQHNTNIHLYNNINIIITNIAGTWCEGGIYQVSNVSNSCKLFDAEIYPPGINGDAEHKREELVARAGQGVLCKKNELWW
jgi:hypothetical protein